MKTKIKKTKKKILIIGGNGFIGRHLVNFIKKKNFFLIHPSRQELNLLKKKKLYDYLNFHRPNIIVNLASATNTNVNSIKEKKKHLNSTYKTAVNLANCAIKGTELIIFFGSIAEYGNCSRYKFENSSTKPETLYGKLKLKACNEVIKIMKKKKINFTWLRPALVYGNMDNTNRYLGHIIYKLKKKEVININPGYQIRDYLFIDDLIKILILMIRNFKLKYGPILNISSQNTVLLRDIPLKIEKILNIKIKFKFEKNKSKINLKLSNNKLMKIFPKLKFTSFCKGLKLTLKRENLKNIY